MSKKITPTTKSDNLSASQRLGMMLDDKLANVKKLQKQGKLQEARNLAAKTAKQASDFGIYKVAYECYEVLTEYYLCYEKNKSYHNRYKKSYQKYYKLYQERKELRSQYLFLHSHLNRRRTIEPSIIEEAKNIVNQINDHSPDHGPFYMHYKFMIYETYYALLGDHRSKCNIALEAYEYFDGQFLSFDICKFIWLNSAAESHMDLKEYQLADELFSLAESIRVEPRTAWNNYVILRSRYYISQLQSADHILSQFTSQTTSLIKYHTALKCFNNLVQGEPVDMEWINSLNDYCLDPHGYGVTRNIIRFWNARINGDEPDYYSKLTDFIRDNGINNMRDISIMKFLLGKKVNFEDLKIEPHRPDVEIVPYEQIIEHMLING